MPTDNSTKTTPTTDTTPPPQTSDEAARLAAKWDTAEWYYTPQPQNATNPPDGPWTP